MNQLKVVSFNDQLVTDSRDVAKMINREHNALMKSIRSYVQYLAEGEIDQGRFFIESTYIDSNNQVRPCFLLTRKGCDMVANKTTGQKGVLFTAEYVTRFEEMEREIKQPKSQLEVLQMTVNELTTHDKRISYLENNMRLSGAQEQAIRKRANAVVVEALGGKSSHAYKKMAFKVFSAFWRDFKNHFEIPRYGDLPKKKFEEGLRFIGMWQPSTSLKIEIDGYNRQQQMEVI